MMRLFKENKGDIKRKSILLLITFIFFTGGLNAQTESPSDFPNTNFWSFDMGFGLSGIAVEGLSFQLVIDPKLWLSPALMVGSRIGVNYSSEIHTDDNHNELGNMLAVEGQVYLRWNFLRFGRKNLTNIFIQGGLGLLAVYRGEDQFLDLNDVTQTRGSVLADAALGITIPLSPRWHIEPSIRGGYPHIWGASITAGYKFPLPQKTISRTEYSTKTEYIEIIKILPPNELIKVIKINAIEFVLFGPDIGRYNVGIDRDAQQLNELVLNQTAEILNNNPDFRIRLEGHANPFTTFTSEAEDLMTLSSMRANAIADQLRARGVSDEQIVIVAFGGTRASTSDWDVRNRNRRVEMMIIYIDQN